jgi:hypothetical protein
MKKQNQSTDPGPVNEEPVKHKFQYLNEVVEDDHFLDCLQDEIRKIKNQRRKVLSDNPNSKLKRSAYDELTEKRQLNPESIRFMYVDILNKRGNYSFRIRQFVELIAGRAVACTIVHYEMPEKEEKEEQR